MHKISTLLFLSLIWSFLISTAIHSQTVILNRQIQWSKNITEKSENQTIELLSFENAIFEDFNTLLPSYSELIDLNNSHDVFNVDIQEKVFEPFDVSSLKNIKNLNKIGENIKISVKRLTADKKPFLEIKFVPIRQNPVSGNYEKLVSFKISVKQSPLEYKSTQAINEYASSSVLSTGKWIKLKIKESGIYKISYEDLLKMGFSNPGNIRLFGNGGAQLSYMNKDQKVDDLKENAIYFELGNDNKFNNGDYILFYGQGPLIWKYNPIQKIFYHKLHTYSDASYYFLTTDAGIGKTIVPLISSSKTPNNTVNSYNDYAYHEENDTNLIKSGRNFYGEYFKYNVSYDFSFPFANRIINDSITIFYTFIGQSFQNSILDFNVNDNLFGSVQIPIYAPSDYTDQATVTNGITKGKNNTKDLKINITFNKSASSGGFLDFFDVNVRSQLALSGHQMHFRDIQSVGSGKISTFALSNTTDNDKVWEITDLYNIRQINSKNNSGHISFTLETDSLREFIAFDGESFLTPEIIGQIPTQDLHKPENINMIILTHPLFQEQAEKLKVYHEYNDHLKTKVVLPEQIYNEFSSGKPDVSAIRNYMKMLYDRSTGDENSIKYLLLVGDGSYKNIAGKNSSSNFILTYESDNSIAITGSFVSDDFFGLLDDDEGEASGLLDIGVGRFPVATAEEAENMVDKVIEYSKPEIMGDWQNYICFVGDDQDNNDHMFQSDSMARMVQKSNPAYNIEKIYLDAYPQISTSNGDKYPDVNKAINDAIHKGVLIFNYVGHGGELGLAHEQVVSLEDIRSWENFDKLPVFVTATCEFSRFDDPNRRAAGEEVLLKPDGGGIALFTTTRIVYSGFNFILNKNFYKIVFQKNSNGENYRLGDVIAKTKNKTGDIQNNRNFSLLGDPAIMLKYPAYNLVLDSINSTSLNLFADTLKALSKIKMSGHVENQSGQLVNNFNGLIFPAIFDKTKTVTTLNNDGIGPFVFRQQNSIIYKGKASVINGNFHFSFYVPKDISYIYGAGKVSLFADDYQVCGNGYYDKIIIGGSSNNAINDTTGPAIKLYMNDENFISGSITNENPYIYAIVRDSSGINTGKNGIGHDIVAIIDDSTKNSYVLNDYYEADVNSYQSGKIKYRLNKVNSGDHLLKLKVWDILNNSSEETIDFVVAASAELAIDRILNYPNPFTEHTGFYFEQNQPLTQLEVLIQIFTVSGKLVKTIETSVTPTGFRVGPIPWDGLDDYGDKIGRGVYIYRIKLKTEDGRTVEKYEKLVILK